MTLEERIRNYRKLSGMSQEQMAEKIGVSRQAITKWETGTGTPDISNIIAISELFQVSIDELLTDKRPDAKQPEYLYESKTEYDIDSAKKYDIKLGGARSVVLQSYEGEKIKVELFSNTIQALQSDYKVKIDDIRCRIDVDLQRTNGATEAQAKDGLNIHIMIPRQYIGSIELAVNAKHIELIGIENDVIEVEGKIDEVVLRDGAGEVEINSNLDMVINLLSHKGSVEINQISATSKIYVPESYAFRSARKGIATAISFEKNGRRVEDFSSEEADNYIELNGMKSELIIAAGQEI